MITLKQTKVFSRWMASLKDDRAVATISARLYRLEAGLAGDAKSVGGGVIELRIHYGPGYRVYLHRRGHVLIILLCGGDKSTQARDIRKAIEMVQNEEFDDETEADDV
ncbi:MAG: type II toxin-antitoxin system RelE/ParE family toxin [Lautropia sp.]|nr:type II toxin-antitoxin system RelE/ParE family toxin [Lautropia sp.]